VAIKINLLPREAAAPARGRAAAGVGAGLRLPSLSLGGGLVIQIATGVLVATVLALAVFGYLAWNDAAAYGKEVTSLKAQNEQLKGQLTELRVAEAAKREIQRRLEVIGKVAKSQGVPVAMMDGVLKAIPDGVWLTSFDMKPREIKVKVEAEPPAISYTSETLARLDAKREEAGAGQRRAATKEVTQLAGFGVVIKGWAYNNFQIADFMDNLRKVGVFTDVDFSVTQAGSFERNRLMTFEVTANVQL
jgi:Tfp pilus assembly protein PilN